MKYKAHPYQAYATNFILEHPIAAILLDMGLGKSVITLTAINQLIQQGQVHKVLVIAPLRVAKSTWPDEIQKWDHLKGLSYSVVIGSPAQRKAALLADTDLYIINRENVKWLVEDSGVAFDFDMLVIDELSSFKSYQAKRFRSLMKVRPLVKRVVGLTGTPSSNGLMDLWAEFKVLDMGQRLGRYISHYRERYFLPDKRNQYVVWTYKPKLHAEEAIYDQINDITISMRSKDYLQMPPLTMNQVKVNLSSSEQEVYDTLKNQLIVEVKHQQINALNAASLANKLCQMANGCVYDEDKHQILIHKRKLDALEDLIEGATGKPVLIAYWFKHDLAQIKSRFKVREIKTATDIKAWNEGQIPIGIIHPASAGHGLNLQAGGSTLIWFGLTWSLELYQQTNARLWRQGQKDPVVIHHLITSGTIDEQIMRALARKDKSQLALIAALKDYNDMCFIIDDYQNKRNQLQDKMLGITSPQPKLTIGRASFGNHQEDHLINSISKLEQVNERYQAALAYLKWFEPAWQELTEDEQWLLDVCYRTPNQSVNKGLLLASDHFFIAKSTAYNKKNQALDHLTLLLYGSHH